MNKIDLNEHWQIRFESLAWGPEMSTGVLRRSEGWLTASLPCDVHMPLLEAGIIKEPLEADYSYESEWIENKSWWFKKEFSLGDEIFDSDAIELTMESLDCEADIFLNGFHLGHHKSAFYPFIRDVKEYLQTGENILLVRLTTGVEYYSDNDISALRNFVSTEKSGGRGDRGDIRRAFVRKPQYVFGWDWGPRVVTCGIVKNVWLESFGGIAVRSVSSHTVCIREGTAVIEFEIEAENLHPYSTREAEVNISLSYKGQKIKNIEIKELLRSGLNHLKVNVDVSDAKLWWPNGMGEQNLYSVDVKAVSGEKAYVYPEFKMGIRTINLDMESISPSERLFAFEVNGIRTFCKGGNWIPADSVYARVTDEKYDTLLKEAREANFNMLRIWGGGIYERDIFYEKCDEYGLMIWHDFMFACALYPDNIDWFVREVEKEIDYQTRRLRNHPSIVLWSGNNEIHWQIAESLISRDEPPFYGEFDIYNRIMPRIVHCNCPYIPYWNSSPYGGEKPNSNEIGDRHHWHDCMMNPEMEKRITPEEYDKITSKFISEYGYVGPCRKSSIVKYHGETPIDRGSRVWQLHNNTFEKDTVEAGIAKHYTDPEKLDIEQYLLYAGLCQGLMYGYSLEALRFKEHCHGGLFWMYDDCWGETGWTIIDYYLRRKISYYFVKRAFAPVKLILRESKGIVRVMGINETAIPASAEIEYGYVSLDGKRRDTRKDKIVIAPRSRKIIFEFEKGDCDSESGVICVVPDAESGILPAVLRQVSVREMKLPAADLKVFDLTREDGHMVFKVKSSVFAHAVHFDLDEDIRLSDEYFDLLPGEVRQITIESGDGSLTHLVPKTCL